MWSKSLSCQQYTARRASSPWLVAFLSLVIPQAGPLPAAEPVTTFRVEVDRGVDLGQNFGSLFEVATSDGELVLGAGFANQYNTRLRGDRHAVQFFVRPTRARRELAAIELPRPNSLCGTYLVARDERLYSTFGGLSLWNPQRQAWVPQPQIGGTQESLRVGEGLLELGDGVVRYEGQTVLSPPVVGTYERFFYALGRLCFYHVVRNDRPYRPFESDSDGFSRLYACPWVPGEGPVDLARAETLRLPVVGETTFAWGQSGSRIVTGSNIGGFYIWEAGRWRTLRDPQLGVSFQLYSTQAFHDQLLMGQYPTGRLFSLEGETLRDLAGWPPVPPQVSGSSREAQTTTIYAGELFVGVWPWGELWQFHPDRREWTLARRLFSHPELSKDVLHPYDIENAGNPVGNQWGQRVTSLVTVGDSLFASTSAKDPCPWNPDQNPFLAPDKWQAYGRVHELKLPGHLQGATRWTTGPTTLEFQVRGNELRIAQDGVEIARTTVTGAAGNLLRQRGKLRPVQWNSGIYGPFGGRSLSGKVVE